MERETDGFKRFMVTSEAFKNIGESVSRQIADLQKTLLSFDFTEIADIVQKGLDKLSPSIRDAVLELGRHGWYISSEMATGGILQLAAGFKQGNPNADTTLVKVFEDKVDEIEAVLVGKFPDRAKAIEAAFRAHRQGEYFLSVPVLLAQTDGICIDITNGSLFMRRNKPKDGSPQTADYVDQLACSAFMNALLSPLATNLPISFNSNERTPGFNHLNRHVIMHGESSDYGTKSNSLKAISLFNYVAQVLTLPN